MRYFFILLVGLFFLASCDYQSTEADGQTNTNTELESVLQKKAVAGDANAQNNLGLMYVAGEGVPKNDGEAVKWYRKAAEQGHARAQYNLGVSYATGAGVPEDDGEAVKWFRKAAEQGLTNAQGNLGLMYAAGDGVPQDFVDAYAWLNIAAAQGKKKAIEARDFCRKRLDSASLAKAQERSREYFKKYVVPFQ